MDLSYIINHLGEEREHYHQAVAPPIFQSSNFTFKDIESMRASIPDELNTSFYTRGCNPTVTILRKKMAALEKAEDALVFGSGVAATSAAIMANVAQGDHIIAVENPYSWTDKLLNQLLSRFGVSVTMIDGCEVENFKNAIRPNTKLIYLESPNSITFELQDLKAVAQLAKEHFIITVIDNSYCSPIYQNPIEYGIDIVTHTASKYLGGHSDLVAGVLCGSAEMILKIFKAEYMTLGGIISPNDAWLILRSLRTLPIRLERVSRTAQQVIDYLKDHPKVQRIYYPFLEKNTQLDLAKEQMRGCGGLFSIEVKANNRADIDRFVNRFQRFLLACSWGGHESLIFPLCALSDSGTYGKHHHPDNLIRFYIGLEDADVLIEDFDSAFAVL